MIGERQVASSRAVQRLESPQSSDGKDCPSPRPPPCAWLPSTAVPSPWPIRPAMLHFPEPSFDPNSSLAMISTLSLHPGIPTLLLVPCLCAFAGISSFRSGQLCPGLLLGPGQLPRIPGVQLRRPQALQGPQAGRAPLRFLPSSALTQHSLYQRSPPYWFTDLF